LQPDGDATVIVDGYLGDAFVLVHISSSVQTPVVLFQLLPYSFHDISMNR
jgi:hypothetical protein